MSKAVRSGRSQFRVSSWLNTLTDTYDYNSHHDEQHIVSTALTLLRIAATLPNTNEGKQQERKHITNTLMTNGYPKKFLQQVEHKRVMQQNRTPSPEELVRLFFDSVETKTNYNYAVLPYIKGLTEPLKRILKPYDIRVTTKPLRTLEQIFPSTKDRPPPEDQTNVVYQINCSDCSWSYIGETGRAFKTRRREHERNVEKYKSGSNIANHAWKNDRTIDFVTGKIIDKGNY